MSAYARTSACRAPAIVRRVKSSRQRSMAAIAAADGSAAGRRSKTQGSGAKGREGGDAGAECQARSFERPLPVERLRAPWQSAGAHMAAAARFVVGRQARLGGPKDLLVKRSVHGSVVATLDDGQRGGVSVLHLAFSVAIITFNQPAVTCSQPRGL